MPDFEGSTYVLLPRLPVALAGPLDLHALSTPPAFILSQDQTLIKNRRNTRMYFVFLTICLGGLTSETLGLALECDYLIFKGRTKIRPSFGGIRTILPRPLYTVKCQKHSVYTRSFRACREHIDYTFIYSIIQLCSFRQEQADVGNGTTVFH